MPNLRSEKLIGNSSARGERFGCRRSYRKHLQSFAEGKRTSIDNFHYGKTVEMALQLFAEQSATLNSNGAHLIFPDSGF